MEIAYKQYFMIEWSITEFFSYVWNG